MPPLVARLRESTSDKLRALDNRPSTNQDPWHDRQNRFHSHALPLKELGQNWEARDAVSMLIPPVACAKLHLREEPSKDRRQPNRRLNQRSCFHRLGSMRFGRDREVCGDGRVWSVKNEAGHLIDHQQVD